MLILINLMAFNAVYVFSQTVNNAYLDTSSPKYEELLFFLDKKNLQVYFSGRYEEWEIERKAFRDYTRKAIDFYNQKSYEASIDNLINAHKHNRTGYGLIYYYLGLCLMDINSLELAKRSFEHAIDFFFNRKMHINVSIGIDDLFSYDDNHVKREPYFSYYNIACIESLRVYRSY
jgi:tetratricopeptide (TPR) repeat protein